MRKGVDLIVISISGCTVARTVQRFSLNVLASTFLARGRSLRDLTKTCRSNKQIRSHESKAIRSNAKGLKL